MLNNIFYELNSISNDVYERKKKGAFSFGILFGGTNYEEHNQRNIFPSKWKVLEKSN